VRRAAARMRAIVVNSGNANCATGAEGMAASLETARAVGRELGCRPEEVIVCSTGVIGVPLRVEKVFAALPALGQNARNSPAAFSGVTRAIMTTDTRSKWAAASCRIGGRRVRILGCAKGAGMIAPRMATMLAFLVTDAAIAPALLQRALREAVSRTFNCITVDGDTSTNDTVAVLASGASGVRISSHSPLATNHFSAALESVCRKLALVIVRDGEGAQRVAEIEVRGAPSARAADTIARTIANSPLVKTALAGADPNWGRILAAAGRAGVPFDPARVEIRLAGIRVFARGKPLEFDERRAHRRLLAPFVKIVFHLGGKVEKGKGKREKGKGKIGASHSPLVASHSASIWTCDFTGDYVRINADYRT